MNLFVLRFPANILSKEIAQLADAAYDNLWHICLEGIIFKILELHFLEHIQGLPWRGWSSALADELHHEAAHRLPFKALFAELTNSRVYSWGYAVERLDQKPSWSSVVFYTVGREGV